MDNESPPDDDASRFIDATSGQKTAVADPPKGSVHMAICQDMKNDATAKQDPEKFYKLAHIWAEKWKDADKSKRDFLALSPAPAATGKEGGMNEPAIKALAKKM